MANKRDLLLLFQRPTEPVFVAKGKNYNAFDVPRKFLTERYRPLVDEIENIFGEFVNKRIPVRDIQLPDLRIPISLGRQEPFSLFIPRHRRLAGRLIDIFMGAKTLDDLQSVTVYARDRVNPYLFNYALSVTLMNRVDTKGLDLPTLAQVFPNKFINAEVFHQAREEVTIVPEGSRMPIVVPNNHTFSPLEPEHNLWYFREDLGINLHHWHWHLVYPFEANDVDLVKKNRRGELFYYMHHQVMARYNVERYCHNLGRIKGLNNFRQPIKRGYFSKMHNLLSTRSYPARCDNATLTDINRDSDDVNFTLDKLELCLQRIREAIKQGFAIDENGKPVYLDENHGIDILANIIEASILSPNLAYYGEVHNMFHLLVSFCHDPQQLHLESFNVIGDSATAMRDPVFYELHTFIDDLFEDHKKRLPPYNPTQLEFDGITITSVQVLEEEGKANELSTFWQQSDVDISYGMDFLPRGNIFVRFTHLQHENFTYTINVSNSSLTQKMGTVRIFLAPKYDDKGRFLLLKDQRLFMLELDRFVVTLNSGVNVINRRSTDSSVTVPYERTFGNLNENETNNENSEFNFCGCGWPQHMLLPKGTARGMQFQLFVMISNYEDDRVQQNMDGICTDASSFCGIRDSLYPDHRAMGFPFDRLPKKGVDKLEQFLTSNMFARDIIIRHENRTILRPIH